ncbi:hypothetical protein QUF72_12240, partial [Desulfobacterales bacterium HSG2]|nr:hypothetical protein [Desulfobacterales bacterium HSG2]
GQTESGYEPGSYYTIEFKNISGWETPDDMGLTIQSGRTVYKTGYYVKEQQATGSVSVTIEPRDARNAGARWRVVDWIGANSWRSSGQTESGYEPGSYYTIEFKNISGWETPDDMGLTIQSGRTVYKTAYYTKQVEYGSIKVTISPSGAISAGAQWRVDGGSWRNSGTTVNSLSVGNHTVSFRGVTGWDSPDSQSVYVSANRTSYPSGNYTQQPQYGSIWTTISPSEAVSAGAQWRVDGGSWQNSGRIVNSLSVGSHTVSF